MLIENKNKSYVNFLFHKYINFKINKRGTHFGYKSRHLGSKLEKKGSHFDTSPPIFLKQIFYSKTSEKAAS